MANLCHLHPAQCATDIGDGSERGEYVCQDHILNRLGRPHRSVNIMYTYYPLDEQWPARISEACADMEVGFAWDYPYDDYAPFSDDGPQFEQMRDIRRHGQDVMLTITIDCAVDDEHIRKLAWKLAPFGRMMVRPNHECNGNWFTHNKRYSREEIATFFVRFSRIFKEEAPNIRCVFCAGLICDERDESGERMVEFEKEFAPAYEAADIWSADKYVALHYGWPYDVAEAGDGNYTADDPEDIVDRYVQTYKRLSKLFGKKPFIQAEFNADGDVTGPIGQGAVVAEYYGLVKEKAEGILSGISMYQFRDRGRLGLEIEDPANPSVGIEQPLLSVYKDLIADPFFSPKITSGEEISYPARLRWGGSEDADGIEIPLSFSGTPEFFEVTLPEEMSIMMEFGGRWFYKAPGVAKTDLMGAFFDRKRSGSFEMALRIFATPPDGENHAGNCPEWNINQYYEIEKEPELRIRYVTPLNG